MFINSLAFTTKGRRNSQLDRIGYYQGLKWSVAYILDGFDEKTPHFVDCVNNNLKKTFSAPNEASSLKELQNLAIEAMKNNIINDGKASIAMLIYVDGQVSVLTAGDTRVYFLVERTRTIDHSKAQELVLAGKLNQSFLNQNVYRKYLTRSIHKGMNESVLEKLNYDYISEDSQFIICSDGFWSRFNNDNDIYNFNLQALNAYLSAVNNEDFSDNASVMLMEWE